MDPRRLGLRRCRAARSLTVAGSLIAVVLAIPAFATAWTPPRSVVPSAVPTGTPDISSGSTGWTALSFTRFLAGSPPQVMVATKGPRKARFGSPRLVSTPGLYADDSQVAVAPDGTVTVVWIGDLPPPVSDTVVMAATKPKKARRFTRPFRLSPLGMGGDPADLSLSVGARGRTVVAWAVENPDGDTIVQSARRSSGKSRFVRPTATAEVSRPASRPRDSRDAGLSAVIASDGSFNYLWRSTLVGSTIEYVRIAGRSVRRQAVSSAGDEREGVIAIARDGQATIVWTNGQSDVFIARRGSARRPFTLRETVVADASEPRIAIARDGTTTIVYRSPLSGEWQPVALTRRPNQAQFGPEEFISPLGGYDPELSIGPTGRVTVVFGRSASFLAPGVVERGPRAPAFGAPIALGPPEATDAMSVTTGGDGWSTSAWTYIGSGNRVVYSVDRP